MEKCEHGLFCPNGKCVECICEEYKDKLLNMPEIDHDLYHGCYQGSDFSGLIHMANFEQAVTNLVNEYKKEVLMLKILGAEEFYLFIDREFKSFKIDKELGKVLKKYRNSVISQAIDSPKKKVRKV